MVTEVTCRLISCQPKEKRLTLELYPFDMDTFPSLCEQLLALLSATLKEKQYDADLHSWFFNVEGGEWIIRAEHYTESVWIEALSAKADSQAFDKLTGRLASGMILRCTE